jgi:protein-L-isoaspartate(D-aspartate) O-methyltransferase
MLAPRVEARMLQDLQVQKHEKVLEIGAGSGYMAALLAHRAQRVISLEINAELARWPRANLQRPACTTPRCAKPTAPGCAGRRPVRRHRAQRLGGRVPQPLLAQLKSAAGWAPSSATSR